MKILAVRTVSKGEAARDEILASSRGLQKDSIQVWRLDLSEFSSVKEFAIRAETELDRLDVLLCNAGVAPAKWEVTKDGWEAT